MKPLRYLKLIKKKKLKHNKKDLRWNNKLSRYATALLETHYNTKT